MLVAADVYRPAAIDQLTILGKKVKTVELAIDACSVSFRIDTCLNLNVLL